MSCGDTVFFADCLDRYFTGSLDTPSAQAPELGEGVEDCASPSVARVSELAAQRQAERAAAAAAPLSEPALDRGPTLQYHVAGVQLGGCNIMTLKEPKGCNVPRQEPPVRPRS